MENKLENLKTDVVFVVSRKLEEETGIENYRVHEIVFSSKNALCRLGELICMLNSSDSFGIFDVTCDNEDSKPVFEAVLLEPIDGYEHPFTENIEEDLGEDTSVTDSVENIG